MASSYQPKRSTTIAHPASVDPSSADDGATRLMRVFLHRPVAVLMLVVAVFIVGVMAFSRIPVQAMPGGFDLPFLFLRVGFENPDAGVSPTEVERNLTRPLEEQLASIPGIKTMRSNSQSGSCWIFMEFESGTPMSVTWAEVKDRVDRVRAASEEEIGKPMIRVFNPNDEPVIEYALGWGEDIDLSVAFRQIDDEVLPDLEGLTGIGNIEVSGDLESYYQVLLRRDDLTRLGVNPWQLAQSLRQANFATSVGTVEDGDRRYFVKADATLRSPQELMELPVTQDIRLRDIATVENTLSLRNDSVFVNGRRAVRLEIFKTSDANTVDLCDRVDATFKRLQEEGRLEGFTLVPLMNQGEQIRHSVDHLLQTAISGGIWAFLILFFFIRRTRLTLLIMLNTPLSLMIGLIVLYFTGSTVNLFSLMGFTLAVGMLVDNAVVVAESISRRREMGESAADASARGAGEVLLAVVLATATSIVVFLPLMLMTGSDLLTPFLINIGFPLCVSLGASLLVALVVIPLAARALAGNRKKGRRRLTLNNLMAIATLPAIAVTLAGAVGVSFSQAPLEWLGWPDDGLSLALLYAISLGLGAAMYLFAFIIWMFAPIWPTADRLMEGTVNLMRRSYEWTLARALEHRLIVVLLVIAAIGLSIQPAITIGESFSERPGGKPEKVRVRASLPPNTSSFEAFQIFSSYIVTLENTLIATGHLAELPPGVTPETIADRVGGKLVWNPDTGELRWRGLKTEQELRSLLAIDPAFSGTTRERSTLSREWERELVAMYENSKDDLPVIPEAARREVLEVRATIEGAVKAGVQAAALGEFGEDGARGELKIEASGPNMQLTFNGLRSALQTPDVADALRDIPGAPAALEELIADARTELPVMPFKASLVSYDSRGGRVELIMDRDDDRWDADDIGKMLVAMLPRYPGVVPRHGWGGGGAGGGWGSQRVNVMLVGPDTNMLIKLAEDVQSRLETCESLADVETDAEEGREELHLQFDRQLTAGQNASLRTISRTLAFNLNGTNLPDLQPLDGPSLPVRMRFEAFTQFDFERGRNVEVNDDLDAVMNSPVPTMDGTGNVGGVVRVQELITSAPTFAKSLSNIRRTDRRTTVNVSAAVKPGKTPADAARDIEAALAGMQMPTGYTWERGEQERRRRMGFQEMDTAALTALFCVFVLMAVFFESIFRPFAIIITVPLAALGVIWTMVLTGMGGDPVVGVGVVILIGLVVNNGIVLVDLINRNVRAGMDRREAIMDAGRHRFRPILMTAATTIVGLIPMAFGSGTFVGIPWYPIARVVIGGLLTSTILTLVVIPVVYSVIDDYLEGRAISGKRRPGPLQRLLTFLVPVAVMLGGLLYRGTDPWTLAGFIGGSALVGLIALNSAESRAGGATASIAPER